MEDRRRQERTEFLSLEDAIRARAYELYEARGRQEGHADEDWRRAEEEIRTGKIGGTAAHWHVPAR
jgi:hypothetical protein